MLFTCVLHVHKFYQWIFRDTNICKTSALWYFLCTTAESAMGTKLLESITAADIVLMEQTTGSFEVSNFEGTNDVMESRVVTARAGTFTVMSTDVFPSQTLDPSAGDTQATSGDKRAAQSSQGSLSRTTEDITRQESVHSQTVSSRSIFTILSTVATTENMSPITVPLEPTSINSKAAPTSMDNDEPPSTDSVLTNVEDKESTKDTILTSTNNMPVSTENILTSVENVPSGIDNIPTGMNKMPADVGTMSTSIKSLTKHLDNMRPTTGSQGDKAMTTQSVRVTVKNTSPPVTTAELDPLPQPGARELNLLWVPYVLVGAVFLTFLLGSFLRYRWVNRDKYARRRMNQEIEALNDFIQMQVIHDMILTDDSLTHEDKVARVMDVLGISNDDEKWISVPRERPSTRRTSESHHHGTTYNNPNLFFALANRRPDES